MSISNRLALLVAYTSILRAAGNYVVIGITLQQVLFGTTNWPIMSAATMFAVGTSSCGISSRFDPSSTPNTVTPVRSPLLLVGMSNTINANRDRKGTHCDAI